MPQAPSVSPELFQSVASLARALTSAARNWALYPPEHPAVRSSLEQLSQTIADSTSGVECSIGVTPDTLLINGEPLPPSQPVAEAAQLLHDRDILRLDFAPGIVLAALQDLMELLSLDPAARRERGGPTAIWAHTGHPSISIEQIDYRRVLEDHEGPTVGHRDDVWQSIVKSIAHGQITFDEIAQKRLLEIAGSALQISELVKEAIAPKCAVDGSPMVATQAAVVVAAFRHLAGITSVMSPDRASDVMRNISEAIFTFDPNVVLLVLQTDDEPSDGVQVVKGLRGALEDSKVANLIAMALAAEGRATARLAQVFNTIAPDPERRARVLRMTRERLTETEMGKRAQFKALWASMEHLLLSYNDQPYVSEGYRSALEGAGARAEMIAARDLPPEVGSWLETVDQEHVRRLSVTMMIDLLRLEGDPRRGEVTAGDLEMVAEDLLLSGDFDNAARVTTALAESAASDASITRTTCQNALEALGRSVAFQETVGVLGDLEPAQFERFSRVCCDLGAETVPILASTMSSDKPTPAQTRAGDIITGYGTAAVRHLEPLFGDDRWFVQLNGVSLLDRIAVPEAVPLLQPLLRKADPRVTPRVVAALAGIDDPEAARAIHTVLRSTTGALRRFVIAALVQERDQRVVPMLERILHESEPFGHDHPIVLETMDALATLAGDRAIPPIAMVIRRTRWFAWRKSRALKQTGVHLLMRVGSPAAHQALHAGSIDGDRLLRRIIRQAQRAAGAPS
jgi:hypothetical protein